MEPTLYEKIGRQEVIIEALRRQLTDVSSLINKFITGEEKSEDWIISKEGQLVKKTAPPIIDTPKKPPGKKPTKLK